MYEIVHDYIGEYTVKFEPLAHKLSSIRAGRFVSDILVEALKRHQKPTYLHTDMGSVYTSSVLENRLATNHIRHSYSKKGHPYDNARIEAFYSILKKELIYPNQFKSKFELVTRISRYIHRYNHERFHTYEPMLGGVKSVQLIDIRAITDAKRNRKQSTETFDTQLQT